MQRDVIRHYDLLVGEGNDPVHDPAQCIDMGSRRIGIYPDTPEEISGCLRPAGLEILRQTETEFAHIFAAVKPGEPG